MKAVLLVAVVLAFAALASAQLGFDGPQCPSTLAQLGDTCRFSSQCACGRQEVDFIFEFDTSGSMCDKLQAVKSGLNRFAQSLQAASTIDYRFALIKFGGTPTWMTPWTTNVTFLTTVINSLNCTDSGQESGFEMMRKVMGLAADNTVNYASTVPSNQRDFTMRPGALVYHIMVTDEDSDCPVQSGNRFSNADNSKQCTSGGNGWFEVPSCSTGSGGTWYRTPGNAFFKELQNTTNIMLNNQVAFAGWVNKDAACVKWQYGPVEYQVGNFTSFDRTATLAAIANLASPLNWTANSLQIKMLQANLTARVYDINLINNPDAVNAFFDNIVTSVACGSFSTCNCGRRDTCTNSICQTNPTFSCSPFASCAPNTYCQLNATNCAADGQYEKGFTFRTSCLSCHPYYNNTAFSSDCTSSDSCFVPICLPNRTCATTPRNTSECICIVNGTIYHKGDKDPNNPGLSCDPRYGTFIDPNFPPYDCSVCPASTECEIVSCSSTDGCIITLANTTNCVCNIGGVQYRVGDLAPNNSALICDPQLLPNGWTDRASIAVCDNYTDCGSCLYQKQACGWCGALERCVPGVEAGPAANTSACAYHWTFTNSKVTNFGYTTANHTPTAADPIQAPNIEVFLRPGVALNVPIKVRRPAIPPLDFYLIVDSSATMGRFVKLVETASVNISNAITNIQNDSRFGLGTFLDKPIQPRGFWPWAFVYKNLVSLNANVSLFKTGASNFQVTYNYDDPESSLEPLMIAAWDTAGTVGWRANAYRVIMVATDTYSFEAGTAESREIGNLPPNNGDGIMDGDPPGSGEDYPSRAQVKAALVQTQALPIFASTSQWTNYYVGVTDFFKFGTVVPFEQNSTTQMVNGIIDGITRNIKLMVMSVESDPMSRVVRITPEVGYTNTSEGDIKDFTITLMAAEGAADYTQDSNVIVRFVGWPYYVNITVKTYVHCQNCDQAGNDSLRYDLCNVCGGDNTVCRGCDGLLWSNVTTDICGICAGDGTGCVDCAGVANGHTAVDLCGVCGGDGSSCAGCDGIANSGAVFDDCNVCGGSNECNAVNTGIYISSAFAAVAAAFAIAAVIFFFLTRAKMMAVDSMLSKQLAAVRSNPLYQSKFKARENPLYRKDNSVEMDEKNDD